MYILVLLLTLYFIFLIYSIAPSLDVETPVRQEKMEGLSLLIPFRNEAENLPKLIASLEAVDFALSVEFVFIDDGSEDDSVSIVRRFDRAQIISTGGEGKKSAIRKGAKNANYPWVLTLDADVKINQELVTALEQLDVAEAKMFLFALTPERRRGFVPAFFDLEFIALQAIGIGLAQKGNPMLSNGACLLFEKEAFAEADKKRKDYHIPTGDDIFGMFAIVERFGRNAVKVATADPLVSVSFPEKMSVLFNQRTRWISKTVDVPDAKYQVLAFIMGLIHLIPLAVFIALFLGLNWPDAVSLLFIKWAGEWIFFGATTKSHRRRDLLLFLPLSQLLHPIYTFALIVSGVNQKLRFKKSKLNAAG